MTETQWLKATDPRPLLRFVGSPGELRHFAVACVRELDSCEWHSTLGGMSDLWPMVLDTADRLAAGSATPDEVSTLVRELNRRACGMVLDRTAGAGYVFQCRLLQETFTQQDAADVALFGLYGKWVNVDAGSPNLPLADFTDNLPPGEPLENYLSVEAIQRRAGRMSRQAAFARDIIDNPFRPTALDPSWLTSNVVTLARGIYADRAFDRIPILADALMDAGCGQDDILSHCRFAGSHVRGCWVVDLILGRSALARAGWLRLVGMTDGFEGRVWMFSEPFEVGRGSGRFLADEPGNSVSRLHAAVFPDAAGWWVAERGSSNGTWLNGLRLDEQPVGPLRAGDILQFATVALRVESAVPKSDVVPTTPLVGAEPLLVE